jgi:hypothetical protein
MATHRMSREEFFAQLAHLDEERLRKALWNLYWRGAAPVRERIEAEIAPVAAVPQPGRRPRLRTRSRCSPRCGTSSDWHVPAG